MLCCLALPGYAFLSMPNPFPGNELNQVPPVRHPGARERRPTSPPRKGLPLGYFLGSKNKTRATNNTKKTHNLPVKTTPLKVWLGVFFSIKGSGISTSLTSRRRRCRFENAGDTQNQSRRKGLGRGRGGGRE